MHGGLKHQLFKNECPVPESQDRQSTTLTAASGSGHAHPPPRAKLLIWETQARTGRLAAMCSGDRQRRIAASEKKLNTSRAHGTVPAAAAAAAAAEAAAPAPSELPVRRWDLGATSTAAVCAMLMVHIRRRHDVVLALATDGPPQVGELVPEVTRARARRVPPGVEVGAGLGAGAVQRREALPQDVQVVAHHLAVGLPPGQLHVDLLLDAVPRPDALRVARQRDRLAADVLAGEGRLGAQPAGGVQPVHRDEVEAILAATLGRGHLPGLRAVPVRGVQHDLDGLESEAAGRLGDPDLVPDHERHAAERRLAHLGQRVPGRRPGALARVEMRLPVLCFALPSWSSHTRTHSRDW